MALAIVHISLLVLTDSTKTLRSTRDIFPENSVFPMAFKERG